MTDFLIDLGANPTARSAIKSLGIPIPLPQKLARAKAPWQQRPLDDANVVFGGTVRSALTDIVARALAAAGANPHVAGGEDVLEAFAAPGEAFGRPAEAMDLVAIDGGLEPRALVYDATGIEDPEGLKNLYDFFHPLVRSLGRCGRIVVFSRPPSEAKTAAAAAAQAGVEGLVRSLSKEIGKKGSTANLIVVSEAADEFVEGPLRFLLSERSAYVTGQPIHVTGVVESVPDPSWVSPLENQVALVTGAARGIGAATARRLAAEGAHVVCLDLPKDDVKLSQLAREIGGTILLADVTAEDTPARAAELLESLGGVNVVVHNAGITRDRTLAKMKSESWDLTVDINLAAIIRINDALLDGVLKDNGRIVCLSSVTGIAGNVGQTNYSASKLGLVGYVRKLAGPLAERGITINAVAPGFIETRLTAAIPPMIREVGRRLCSLSQGGKPVDVAEVITFLGSPGAAGLTGETIRVCGGALIGA